MDLLIFRSCLGPLSYLKCWHGNSVILRHDPVQLHDREEIDFINEYWLLSRVEELKIFINWYAKVTGTTENRHELSVTCSANQWPDRKRGRYIEYGWKFEFCRSIHAWSLHSGVQEGRKSRPDLFVPGRVLLWLCYLHFCGYCTIKFPSGFWLVCIGHRWEEEAEIRKDGNYLCVQLCKPFWMGNLLCSKGLSGRVQYKNTLHYKTSAE